METNPNKHATSCFPIQVRKKRKKEKKVVKLFVLERHGH